QARGSYSRFPTERQARGKLLPFPDRAPSASELLRFPDAELLERGRQRLLACDPHQRDGGTRPTRRDDGDSSSTISPCRNTRTVPAVCDTTTAKASVSRVSPAAAMCLAPRPSGTLSGCASSKIR